MTRIASRFRFRRRAALTAMLAVAALASGCAPRRLSGPDLGPTEPVMLTADAEQAIRWRNQWTTEPDLPGRDGVQRVGVLARPVRVKSAAHGRILCRLILHGADLAPVRSDGPIRAVLVARPNLPDEAVVGSWSLTAAEAAERFRFGRLPGYHLDLLWPRPASANVFRIIFRWTDRDGKARQTSQITFEDTFGYEVPSTPERPARQEPADQPDT